MKRTLLYIGAAVLVALLPAAGQLPHRTGIVSQNSSGGGGSSSSACAGAPGATTAIYKATCVPANTPGLFVCGNPSGCTVAADWVMATAPIPTSGLSAWWKPDCTPMFYGQTCIWTPPSNGTLMAIGNTGSSGILWPEVSGNQGDTVSANANPFFQTMICSGGTQPPWVANDVNGFGAWNFSNCQGSIGDVTHALKGTGSGGSISGYAVVNFGSVNTQHPIMSCNGTTCVDWGLSGAGKQYLNLTAIATIGSATTVLTSGGYHILGMAFTNNTNTPVFRTDKAADTTVNGTSENVTSGITRLVDNRTDSNLMNGKIPEIIIWNRALSGTEMQQVEAYLHDKYNL